MVDQPTSDPSSLDRWTIAAIAIVVYIVTGLAHEAVGHGGSCLLTGCRARLLDAHYFEWDDVGFLRGTTR
jgi:hypothetical protein